jgi:hypothetical protein
MTICPNFFAATFLGQTRMVPRLALIDPIKAE